MVLLKLVNLEISIDYLFCRSLDEFKYNLDNW